MMLVKRFYLKDIRSYEDENRANILEFFNNIFDITKLVELVKIANRVDEKTACNMIDEYTDIEENSIKKAFIEVRDTLLGKPVEQGNESNLQTVQFNSMTELLNELCKQAMSYGLTYTEFWNMDTKEMYQVIDGIKDRQIEEANRDLEKMYTLACMVGASVWGKLGKEPPQVYDPNKTIYTDEFGEIDMQTYKQLQAIGAIR